MRETPYYSIRTGKNPLAGKFDLPTFIRFFLLIYKDYTDRGYFQEAFGISCTDGYQPGSLGENIDDRILWKLRKSELWPIEEKSSCYSEDDIFDIIEFLFDYVSCPVDGYYHSFADCGMHYHTFQTSTGREEFRDSINEILREYQDGYELSPTGEIQAVADPGLDILLATNVPIFDDDNVESRIKAAILKFRRHRASTEDKKEAIRILADVSEFLRPQLKAILTKKDEADLFQLANNFGIRHHNIGQQTNYDQSIWYGWMFFYYLATIHASLRLLIKSKQ